MIDAHEIVEGWHGINVAPEIWLASHPVNINLIINLINAQQAVQGLKGRNIVGVPAAMEPRSARGQRLFPNAWITKGNDRTNREVGC